MRTAFIEELVRQARVRDDIFLVVGDLGYSVVEPFADEFPDRFLNAGVAEQNMTGVAAGLASEGYHVFTYSIANFPTFRCLEQIRNDVAYHRLSVTVVAVGAGVAYGSLGYSHHAVQDIGVMRMIPELTLLSPADPGEANACVQWLAEHPCPSYLRIGKAGEPRLSPEEALDRRPRKIREGRSELALVCTGSVLKVALEVHEAMKESGLEIAVFSCPWLSPMDEVSLSAFDAYKSLLVLEEHLPMGGLTSILQERIAERKQIRGVAIDPALLGVVGSQQELLARSGLHTESVLETCRRWIQEQGHVYV